MSIKERVITFSVDDEIYGHLKSVDDDNGLTVSEVVKAALMIEYKMSKFMGDLSALGDLNG